MAKLQPSREMIVAFVLSVGLHGLWLVQDAEAARLRVNTPAEVILEAYEAPVPKVEPPPPEPESKPIENTKPEPVRMKSVSNHTAQAVEPPPTAQAGKTLTAADDAPSDMADFTLVQGTGSEYVGGTTSSIGTNSKAVHGAASDRSKPLPVAARESNAVASGPDLSTSPRPTGSDWNCSRLFPQDPEAGDYATVSIVVTVATDGTPKAVTVLRDPGHGFGAAARTCAMSQRYSVGLNRQGQPTQATTPPITVRFTR